MKITHICFSQLSFAFSIYVEWSVCYWYQASGLFQFWLYLFYTRFANFLAHDEIHVLINQHSHACTAKESKYSIIGTVVKIQLLNPWLFIAFVFLSYFNGTRKVNLTCTKIWLWKILVFLLPTLIKYKISDNTYPVSIYLLCWHGNL